MKLNRIYLDLDGVIVDFVGGCHALFGKPVNPQTSYDIHSWWDLSPNEFWNRIAATSGFWSGLKPYQHAQEFVTLLKTFTKEIVLVTSPTLDPQCAAEKTEWIQTYFKGNFRNYIITSRKELLEKDGLLIDDSNDKINKFRIYDGRAILFPQPWNALSMIQETHSKLSYIEERLKEFFG